MDDLTVPGFGGRPAIAVLAFDNLSGDPDQEYFADGIAEDLITRLSAQRWVPVIARNSSFTYKGKAVDVKQVSRELGVRYVVEGSVRKAGERVRISAQLIDATTGEHVWAERYDRDLSDVFSLQDEITEAIVGSMFPELARTEQSRAARKDPQSLEAWECVSRGWWYTVQLKKDDNRKARLSFERSIELDPEYADGFAGLAATHHSDVLFQWTDSRAESIAELERAAQRAAELDPKNSYGQLALGYAYSVTGQRERMLAACKLAVQLNPSLPAPYRMLGFELAMAARADEAISTIEKAMRLDPHSPNMWMSLYSMALAHMAAERYEEAIAWAQRSLQRRSLGPTYRVMAASCAHLGRMAEARAAIDELLRREPDFSLAAWKDTRPAMDSDLLGRWLDGLRKAGLPEE
jgi:adenylate cyclase